MDNQLKYETENYKFRYYDGIFHLTYLEGPINEEVARDIVDKRLEVSNGKGVLVLIDDLGLKSVDRSAREFFSSEEGIVGIVACAFSVKSVFGKYLANFFLRISVSKSKFPAKVFSNEDEAIEWLKENDIA